MQATFARLIPLLLCLALCLGAQGDAVSDLVSAIKANDENRIKQADEKLMSMDTFPSASVAQAIQKATTEFIGESDEKKKQPLEQIMTMLAEVASYRGGFQCVDAIIPLIGLGPSLSKTAEKCLGRLTCHGVGANPPVPEGAKKSDNPLVNRQQAWTAWWHSQKDKPGVKGTSPDESSLIIEQLIKNGVGIPKPDKLTANDAPKLVSALLAGCSNQKPYVRFWSARLMSGLLGKDFPFDEEAAEGARSKIIGEMKGYWEANKAKVLKNLAAALKKRGGGK